MYEHELIYDWNTRTPGFSWESCRVELNDETLRDGLQSPSVTDPSIEDKKALLHLMAQLGIAAANIGLPGAGPRTRADTLALAKEIVDAKLPISANAAARTLATDIEPIARIAQETGLAIEAATFIGSSPIRQYAEEWTLEKMVRVSEEAVRFAVGEGLSLMFVTEDTTRAKPETLRALYGAAIACGARRICLADTVGHATPDGVRALVRFVREEIVAPTKLDVRIDWHGHRDRGHGLATCLAAIEAGVDRVHGTALGIGERVGNAEMDLLLINLRLLGAHEHDLRKLPEYTALGAPARGGARAARDPGIGAAGGRPPPPGHPAAAIAKAHRKGDAWLADRIYSGVPAGDFGLSQRIDVSHVSGISNVRSWLEAHGHDASDEPLCRFILDAAKKSNHTLRDEELVALIAEHRRQAVTA